MTACNFAIALAFTLGQEGGWSDDPNDPGGATNQGITLATFRDWCGASQTVDDLRDMSHDTRDEIYRRV